MPSPAWEVVSIAKLVVSVITNLRLTGNSLQYQTTDVYVQCCESGPNEEWITWHEAGEECEEESVVSGQQFGECEPSMALLVEIDGSGAFGIPVYDLGCGGDPACECAGCGLIDRSYTITIGSGTETSCSWYSWNKALGSTEPKCSSLFTMTFVTAE